MTAIRSHAIGLPKINPPVEGRLLWLDSNAEASQTPLAIAGVRKAGW
jgi:hypothetical protein